MSRTAILERIYEIVQAVDEAETKKRLARGRVAEEELPLLILDDGEEVSEEVEAGHDDRRLFPVVRIELKADDETTMGTEINALAAAVIAALGADPTLGGRCQDLRQTKMSEPAPLDLTGTGLKVSAEIEFEAFYTARRVAA